MTQIKESKARTSQDSIYGHGRIMKGLTANANVIMHHD
jgi:hypothetical protein